MNGDVHVRFCEELGLKCPCLLDRKSTAAWALPNCESCGSWSRAAGAEENAQLKKLVADLSLDKQMLQDVIKKSCKAPLQKGNGQLAYFKLSRLNSKGTPVCEIGSGDVLLQIAPS